MGIGTRFSDSILQTGFLLPTLGKWSSSFRQTVILLFLHLGSMGFDLAAQNVAEPQAGFRIVEIELPAELQAPEKGVLWAIEGEVFYAHSDPLKIGTYDLDDGSLRDLSLEWKGPQPTHPLRAEHLVQVSRGITPPDRKRIALYNDYTHPPFLIVFNLEDRTRLALEIIRLEFDEAVFMTSYFHASGIQFGGKIIGVGSTEISNVPRAVDMLLGREDYRYTLHAISYDGQSLRAYEAVYPNLFALSGDVVYTIDDRGLVWNSISSGIHRVLCTISQIRQASGPRFGVDTTAGTIGVVDSPNGQSVYILPLRLPGHAEPRSTIFDGGTLRAIEPQTELTVVDNIGPELIMLQMAPMYDLLLQIRDATGKILWERNRGEPDWPVASEWDPTNRTATLYMRRH